MLLKKIRTKGFLGHLANKTGDFIELDFADKNLWLIQGANGAGKSSLFDAITMAFFKQHRGGASNFANLVHDKADRAELFIEFVFHGNDYQIAVDIPKKSTVSRRLKFWNGVEWATKSEDVDDWVVENLKISFKTFVSSVLLRQGEADKFILAQPRDRKKVFLELMQLEFYTKLSQAAKSRQTSISNKVAEQKQKLVGLKIPTISEIKAQEKLVKQFVKDLENLEEAKSAKQKELDGARRAQSLKSEIEKIEAQQRADVAHFEKAAQTEEKYNHFIELKDNLFRFENVWREKHEIARIEKDFRENEQRFGELKAELETVAEKLNARLSSQEAAKVELLKLESDLSLAKTERDALKLKVNEISQIENLESQIERANKDFQSARKAFTESADKIAELENQIEETMALKESLDEQLQETETDFRLWSDRLENRRKGIDEDVCPICGSELKREEKRKKLLADFEEAKKTVAELEQRRRSLGEDFAEIKRKLSAMGESCKIEAGKHKEISDKQNYFKNQIEFLKSQITISYAPPERESLRAAFVESEKRADEFEIRFTTARDEFENLRQTAANLGNQKIRCESDLSNIVTNQKNLQSRKEKAEMDLTVAENQISGKWKTHAALKDAVELENLRREKDELQNIEAEHEKLRDARNRRANLEGRIETLTSQIPENHRQDVGQVESEFNTVVEKTGVVRKQCAEADNLCRKMQEDKQRYDEKSGELKTLENDLKIWKTLVKALGKDGLETKVVSEAQQKIESNANKTLQALSDGRFKIEIPPDSKEMKIFVRDFSTGEQRQIEYFSGGEKFLTAVSLAIAIGQSASGQNIANTLIIDEGFGFLDDKNRGLMVGELMRLSEILQNGRVIIVSHQDDVQENFANRYRLSKTDQGFTSVETSAVL